MIDLAVVTQDPRFGGGARALLEAFWTASSSIGRDPQLFYLEHPSLADRDLRSPLDARGLRPPFRRLDPLNQLWGARRLVPELRSSRSLWVVAATAQYGFGAAVSGRPYACWVATTLADEWRRQMTALPPSRRLARHVNGQPLQALERAVLRRAAAVYVISPAARAAVASAAGLPPDRVSVIPLPVDLDTFVPISDEQYLEGLDTPTVLFVGRGDDPRKNLPLLLAAWPSVLKRHPRARLRLVGRPPRGPLPAGAEALGEVPSAAAELSRATIFVLPSLQEGFGIVVAEALAAGVPVVTTPSGGPEDLVRRSRGGLILNGFDCHELANVVSNALEDRVGLLRMREAGRTYVDSAHSPQRTRDAVAAALASEG